MMTRRQLRRAFPLLALIGSSLLLFACGSGPPPRLYLLEPLPPSEGDTTVEPGPRLDTLGLMQVKVPGYAETAQIASILPDGTIEQSPDHRWAESPDAAITRLLADRLRLRSGATVLSEPWPRDYQAQARVEVVFDRLLREPRGGADMAGQILLLSGDGRTLLQSVPFEFVLYGRETSRRVYFVAVAKALDDIALMTIRALHTLRLDT